MTNYINNKDYRKDIDGLRAIAVIAVIINHLAQNILPGGFVGVDIFFVISGFLITSHIYKSIKSQTFSFQQFYKKRINRIVPALLTVITVSIIFGFFLLSPADLIRLTYSALTSITGISNFYFWREYGNYFSANADEAILLHTWSLGVEEQFYLFWPIILFFITKFTSKSKYILFLLLTIFISALLFSQHATTLFASASYYLLPTRFFELAIGGLLAIYPTKKLNNSLLFYIPKTAGFLLIFYSFLTFNVHTVFPGINAFIPCLGACLIIASGNYGNPSLILSTKPLQYTGLLSYSMYLWHWPIIAYLNYLYIPINLLTSFFILISTFILSFLTWKYIETPFRNSGNKNKFNPIFIKRLAIPVILLLGLTLTTKQWQGFPQRYLADVYTFEQITLAKPNELRKHCHVPNQLYQTELNPTQCTLGIAKSSIDGLLIGDSYANHFSGMIDEIAKANQLRIIDYTMDACPPILNYTNNLSPSYAQRCISRNNHIAGLIEKNQYQYIILAADWPQNNNDNFYYYIRETINKLSSSNSKLIIIFNNPMINHAATCPVRKTMFNLTTDCSAKQSIQANYWTNIQKLYPHILFIDPNNIICQNNLCSPILQNTPLYRDNGHLNDIGSRLLGQILVEQGISFPKDN